MTESDVHGAAEMPEREDQPTEWTRKNCLGCQQEFQTRNDSWCCFGCTLHQLTGGGAPEEGDFATAKIQSGTLTDEELRMLREDLAQVEPPDPYPYEDEEGEEWTEDLEESPFERYEYEERRIAGERHDEQTNGIEDEARGG